MAQAGKPMTLQCTRPLRFLITGAGRGLGRGLARLLFTSGHDVYLLDSDAKELEHTLTKHLPSLQAQQPAARFGGTTCDVADAASVQAALCKARDFHRDGKVEVLINNAARADPYWKSIESLSKLDVDPLSSQGTAENDAVLAEWQEYMHINLTGAFLVTRMALGMLRNDGSMDRQPNAHDFRPTVIFISSTRARQSEPNHEPYASSKAGLLGLNHALASSLQPLGIRSNAILPGWIPSGHESIAGDTQDVSWHTGLSAEDQSQHWSGRVGRVEDLLNAVLFLASTRFANGEEIVLDGGMTRKLEYVE